MNFLHFNNASWNAWNIIDHLNKYLNFRAKIIPIWKNILAKMLKQGMLLNSDSVVIGKAGEGFRESKSDLRPGLIFIWIFAPKCMYEVWKKTLVQCHFQIHQTICHDNFRLYYWLKMSCLLCCATANSDLNLSAKITWK